MKHNQDILKIILTTQLEILRRLERIEGFFSKNNPDYTGTEWRHLADIYLEMEDSAMNLEGDIEEFKHVR